MNLLDFLSGNVSCLMQDHRQDDRWLSVLLMTTFISVIVIHVYLFLLLFLKREGIYWVLYINDIVFLVHVPGVKLSQSEYIAVDSKTACVTKKCYLLLIRKEEFTKNQTDWLMVFFSLCGYVCVGVWNTLVPHIWLFYLKSTLIWGLQI